MRIFRLTATLVGALALLAVFATAAHADPYPPSEPNLTANATTVVQNAIVTFTGDHFAPHEPIDITRTTTPLAAGKPARVMVPAAFVLPLAPTLLAKVTADSSGKFTFTLRLTTVGRNTIVATGEVSGRIATIVITVLAKSGGGGGLPKTGRDYGQFIVVGGSLVGAGLVLVLGTLLYRRRRSVPVA